MAYNNGKITAPVSHSDINAVLGTIFTELEDMCTAQAINKYSIKKPIANTMLFGSGERTCLTDNEAKGASDWQQQGVVYGVKSSTYQPSAIHTCDWSFLARPDGVNYPHRQQDFDGYDHFAMPTLWGEIITAQSGKISYNSDEPFTFNLRRFVNNNTTGVQTERCVYNYSGNVWYAWHLGVMIDNYATIMINHYGGQYEIGEDDGVDTLFTCPPLPDALLNTATRNVSFFLIDIYGSGDIDVWNMTYDWAYFDTNKTIDVPLVTIPNAVNYSLQFV